MAKVIAVCTSQTKGVRKENIKSGNLKEEFGLEGDAHADSGWHRQKLGQMPKLAAYTPINFSKGLITGVTDIEEPARNLWGVCVVAPVEEVSGQVKEVSGSKMAETGIVPTTKCVPRFESCFQST